LVTPSRSHHSATIIPFASPNGLRHSTSSRTGGCAGAVARALR
jgi:hypothetical protein